MVNGTGATQTLVAYLTPESMLLTPMLYTSGHRSASSGNLLEIQILKPHPRLPESEDGGGAQQAAA